jgi:hypothetical protein
MKLKKYLLLGLVLVTQASFANITVMSGIAGADACDGLAGNWAGSGTVTASILTCNYSGKAVVTQTITNEKTNYSVAVDLTLDSGPLCPATESITLPGYCESNGIVLQTDDANLTGSVDSTGTAADLKGYVYVTIGGTRIKADITKLHLDKSK